jgi:hypothetical protein
MGYRFSPLSARNDSPYDKLYSPLTPSLSYERNYAPEGIKKNAKAIFAVCVVLLAFLVYLKQATFTEADLTTGKWKHLAGVIKFMKSHKFAPVVLIVLIVGAGYTGSILYEQQQQQRIMDF